MLISRSAALLASILTLSLSPALAAGGGEATRPAPMAGDALRPVQTEIAALHFGSERPLTGTVAALSEADLGFTVTGRLAERPAGAGDQVAAGGVLAVLDPEDLEASLRAAAAQVAQAEAQLSQLNDAETRARALRQRGVASAVQLENATRARISAQSALDQARAAQSAAADRRDATTLRAPGDGIVTATYAETGATLSAGQPVLHFASREGREVVVDLTETDLAGLSEGQSFTAALAAAPDIHAIARLTRIDPVADGATRTRRAHLTLSDPPVGMRLGALVHLTPETSAGQGLLSVPARAIITRADGQPGLWLVHEGEDGSRHVTPRAVTLIDPIRTPALYRAGRVAISDGLSPGDEVVTRGLHSLSEGQIVGPPLHR